MNEILLTKNNISDVNATFALGSLVSSELLKTGQCFVFFNILGEVQFASKEDLNRDPPLPLALLDTMSVEDVVRKLMEVGVIEERIRDYLISRKTRISLQ